MSRRAIRRGALVLPRVSWDPTADPREAERLATWDRVLP
jgi:hypothetical protein